MTCDLPLPDNMTPQPGGGVEVHFPKVEPTTPHKAATSIRHYDSPLSTTKAMFKFDFDVEAEEPKASGSTVAAPLQRGEVKPCHDISLKELVSALILLRSTLVAVGSHACAAPLESLSSRTSTAPAEAVSESLI